jgi:hypothetical protein
MPKGEKLIGQRIRTTPPPFFEIFLIFQIGSIAFAKTLLKAKRRKLVMSNGRTYSGAAKGKTFEKGGESFELKTPLKSL